MAMTCRDAIDVLADFLDDLLTPELAAELEAHLRDCRPCRAYLNTYRRTRGLIAQEGRVEMPAELKVRLRQFLIQVLREENAGPPVSGSP